jgi:recombination protein RecR
MLKIEALDRLIQELTRLPGIGPKTAQRLAYFILKSPPDYGRRLSAALVELGANVKMCIECFNFTDRDRCFCCLDHHRTEESLCIVEEPSDIATIEKSQAFRGRYHVLHGAISPLDGVGPDQLKIKDLINRIEERADSPRPIREIIFALDPDLEGDTTVLYISRLLQGKGIKLSRIAQGIPIGSDIDYIDDRTINRALVNRTEI